MKMDSSKKSENSGKILNGLKTVATGLFISTEKSRILLKVVQEMLKQKYLTVAVSGPPQANNTSEILLRALSPTGVDFAKSQIVLEQYLNMIKESRPNFILEKQPQVIEIEDQPQVIELGDEDEEISCIVLDDTLDTSVIKVETLLDDSNAGSSVECDEISLCNEDKMSSSEAEGKTNENDACGLLKKEENLVRKCMKVDSCELTPVKTSNYPYLGNKNTEKLDDSDSELSRIVTDVNLAEERSFPVSDDTCRYNIGHDKTVITESDMNSNCEITVIDSVMESKAFSNTSKHLHPVERSFENVNKSPKNSKQRKKYSSMKDIEVIDIEDDEVIILDDSISTSDDSASSSCSQGVIDVEVRFNEWSKTVDPKRFPEFKNKSATSTLDDSAFSFKSNGCVSSSRIDEARLSVDCTKSKNKEEVSRKRKSEESFPTPAPLKKNSKLAYRRPAHLISPLVKTVSSVSSIVSRDVVNSNSNIYNPNSGSNEKRKGLRPIIIDGNNVGVSHGKGNFSLKGVQICINFFEIRGHRQIKAFLPHYRKNRDTHEVLTNMERQGTVVITPSRKVNGKVIASYDDRYIVQYAAEMGGVIVTLDNYRDLLNESQSWKETIEKRLLMFSWVDDLLMFPQDPLGKNGPKLDQFLKFPD